jgi:hypothetical protein
VRLLGGLACVFPTHCRQRSQSRCLAIGDYRSTGSSPHGPLRRAARYDGVFPANLEHPNQLAEVVAIIADLRRDTTNGAVRHRGQPAVGYGPGALFQGGCDLVDAGVPAGCLAGRGAWRLGDGAARP